jgi:hypothetical protein
MTAQRKYKLMGVNSDEDTCSCCGKTNLKRVMWLMECDEEGNANGEVFPMGTTCGSKKMGISEGEIASADRQGKVAKLAQTWLAKGYELKVVLNAIGNKTAYQCIILGEEVLISWGYHFHAVTAEKITRVDMTLTQYKATKGL